MSLKGRGGRLERASNPRGVCDRKGKWGIGTRGVRSRGGRGRKKDKQEDGRAEKVEAEE